MKRLLLLQLMLACAAVASEMPQFDDPFLGRLVVSKKKFPFLTAVDAPETEYAYPTDEQMKQIKRAVGGRKQLVLKSMAVGDEKDGKKDGDNDTSIDLRAVLELAESAARLLGNFLKTEFTYEVLNSTIADYGTLPFNTTNANVYFKAMSIPEDKFNDYVKDTFPLRMRTIAQNLTWLPAEWIIQELEDCRDFGHGFQDDEDLKYNQETGGIIIYFKVACQLTAGKYYVGLSYYENQFTLRDVEHIELYRIIKKGWFRTTDKSGERRWFDKKPLSLGDQTILENYILNEVGQRIQKGYKKNIDAANAPLPAFSVSSVEQRLKSAEDWTLKLIEWKDAEDVKMNLVLYTTIGMFAVLSAVGIFVVYRTVVTRRRYGTNYLELLEDASYEEATTIQAP